MVALGFGEITGCISSGYLIDRIGSKKVSYINLGCVLATILATYGFLHMSSYNALTFIMTFMWGL